MQCNRCEPKVHSTILISMLAGNFGVYLVLMIPLSKPSATEIVYTNLNIQQDIA